MYKTNSHQSRAASYLKRIVRNAASIVCALGSRTTAGLAFAIAFLIQITANAQDGNAGITEATMRIRSYFATGTSLMYAIGSVVGLVGAVKVFQKWNSGDQDTGKVAAAWFGSCVFLVIVATVLRSFFGV